MTENRWGVTGTLPPTLIYKSNDVKKIAWWKLNYNQKIIIVPEYKTADVKIFVQT